MTLLDLFSEERIRMYRMDAETCEQRSCLIVSFCKSFWLGVLRLHKLHGDLLWLNEKLTHASRNRRRAKSLTTYRRQVRDVTRTTVTES
jgi:hypothetical protein